MRIAMLDTQPRSWQSPLAPEQAAPAISVARDIAARLREPEQVEAATAAAKRQSSDPSIVYWTPYGLAQGWAGMAVMAGYLDACFPDEEWDAVGHAYLSLAARGSEGYGYLPASLWAGLSGLAFATW